MESNHWLRQPAETKRSASYYLANWRNSRRIKNERPSITKDARLLARKVYLSGASSRTTASSTNSPPLHLTSGLSVLGRIAASLERCVMIFMRYQFLSGEVCMIAGYYKLCGTWLPSQRISSMIDYGETFDSGDLF